LIVLPCEDISSHSCDEKVAMKKFCSLLKVTFYGNSSKVFSSLGPVGLKVSTFCLDMYI